MPFSPFGLPITLLAWLFSVALLAGGLYFAWAWYTGVVVGTSYLVGSLLALAWTFVGRFVVLWVARRPGPDEPVPLRSDESLRLERPDGSALQVELFGPADAPALVLTHGWGTNSTEFYYLLRRLAGRFRVIAWDLPGLGKSDGPANDDYSLEKLAHDLEAVLGAADGRSAVLLGHSIGGMIIQTFCRLFPQHLGTRVAGLVLLNTTDTDPTRTTALSGFIRAIKPALTLLLQLMIPLSPVVWLLNLLSFANGSAHIAAIFTGFAGHETRGQLNFATQFQAKASPAVVARGALATFTFDERRTLPAITVPALVIGGDIDRITVPQASADIARAIPLAELHVVRPAGHMALLERPETVADLVEAFSLRCAQPPRARAGGGEKARG